MLFDSGSSVSCMSNDVYVKYFNNFKLKQDNTLLKSYNGSIFSPKGYFLTSVKHKKAIKQLRFQVIDNGGPCILGRDFVKVFGLRFKMVNKIDETEVSVKNEIQGLVKKYPDVFTHSLGLYKHAKISINLKPNARPVFFKPRTIPLAYKKPLEEQLSNMMAEGILTPVDASEWATPLVPIIKSDGQQRICADYRSTINKWIMEETYALPRIDEIFSKLHQGQHFTKLDLCQAYNQFELDDEAKKLLV